MDATTGATIVASVINSSSLNCSSSSSNSSGYGSSHSATSTPIGNPYETTAHTPVSAPTEHVPPTATVAPVTPCWSEASLGQQQRQQYYQSYSYPNAAAQYNPIYDAYTGNSYHNLTTPNVERSLSLGSSHNSGNNSNSHISNNSNSSQQRLEKPLKNITSSSGSHHYSNAVSSATTTTSASTKPQATATPFFAQPSSNLSASSSSYFDTYGKYKMPSSTKLATHAATDYANYTNHLQLASLNYQQQQQHYYAAAKSQLQDANYAVKPHRQHSINSASPYYGNSGTYYDKYEKYMYAPTVGGGAAYGASAPTHTSHPYSPHEPTTSDPYRKVAAAAAANAWHWNMEYATGNCRNLPPTLSAAGATATARDAFCATTTDKYSKYDKYSAYYGSPHHPQQYMTSPSSATSSRNLWPNTTHHTPHLASVPPVLNERLTHTLPSAAAAQQQYPHTHPHASHHSFASATSASNSAQRQSCCAQPFQQQSCYYPRPSQQHPHSTTTNPYAPPQQSHYGNMTSASSGSHKYGAYSNSFKSNNSSNDLFITSPFETTPPAYNYGTTSAAAVQSRYGASSAAFFNDLSMQTAFDGFSNTAISQPPILPQHNVVAHSAHLGYQALGASQNPSSNALLDYRKPSASGNEYCLNPTRSVLSGLEQHVANTAGFLTFDIHGNPIAQTHPVITSPTIYSDGGSSSEKSTPTTKNIRDFLSTWSEGEEEESAQAEQLSFAEGEAVKPLERNYLAGIVANQNTATVNRPKIHVEVAVDGSMNVDSSQFINLPDIVIDIEKSNNGAPAGNTTTPNEHCAQPEARPSSPMEHHSPCGGHEIFENFDVEKEIDELQIKRAKLCLEKQLNNEIRILTPEPTEPPIEDHCEDIKQTEKPTQYQQLTATHHTECEKSFEHSNNFLKDMELNDTTSHSSNSSTFEKEYETFINRIENDKIDVGREQKLRNETDTNVSQIPVINEDSGSISHQSSGIKTPPDPTDIEDLTQKSIRPLSFTGNSELETSTQELLTTDFRDCVQDLSIHAMDANQKSMDDTMALQNFEEPPHVLLDVKEIETERFKAVITSNELIKQASDNSVDQQYFDDHAKDLSTSKDCSYEEDFNVETPPQDFSMFYKKKRKFLQDSSSNESCQPITKQSKFDEECLKNKETATEKVQHILKRITENQKRKKLLKSKRRPLSLFYKNLHNLKLTRNKVNTTTLVQQHVALLKERHLPLIKRQSIKNLSGCNKIIYNPGSLKCLAVSIVNTNEFRKRILIQVDASDRPKEIVKECEAPNKTEEEIIEEVESNILMENSLSKDVEIKKETPVEVEKQSSSEADEVQCDERAEPNLASVESNKTAENELPIVQNEKVIDAKEAEDEKKVENYIENNATSEILEKTDNLVEAPENKDSEENLKDALEEQSSATISENWSSSLKEQEDFKGFEDRDNSKQTLGSTSDSRDVSLDASMETEDKDIMKMATENSIDKIQQLEEEPTTVNDIKHKDTIDLKNDSISEFEPNLELKLSEDNETSKVFNSLESNINKTEENITIINSYTETENETETEQPKLIETNKNENTTLLPASSVSNSDSDDQPPQKPLMRTKASVKMCDFSDMQQNRKITRARSKSKSLNSLKLKIKDKRSLKSLETTYTTTSDVNQKPAFQGIGKMDKTKFVEKWAASLISSETPKLEFSKSRTMRADSTEVLDLSPTSQYSVKNSPNAIDENSNSSTSTSSSSSSSSSSTTSSSQNSKATPITSSNSQSSSNESSSEDSDFNEMKALEKELSQHKTNDEWAKSVARMVADDAGNAIKTDKVKLETFEAEATNQDIENLKKILESEQDIKEVLLPAETETNESTENKDESVEMCVLHQPMSLKDTIEEFTTRQAAKLRENDKLRIEAAEKQANQQHHQQQQQIVIPKSSDLRKIALNSSFVINELSVNQNENEENLVVKNIDEKSTPPNSPKPPPRHVDEKPKSTSQQQEEEKEPTAMTVEEELAEMYRQAGVISDPEENVDDDDDDNNHLIGENHAQDYLLINLAEILSNSDNESNVFLLQCDMNENVLRVMTTSPSGDNNDQLVIGEVSNVDVENSNAVQIVQLVNANDLQVVTETQTENETETQTQHVEIALSSSKSLPLDNINENSLETYVDNDFNTSSPYVDLPIIHHEEIVPDNYKKFQKEQFLKYLHAKYVQKHVKRFYHANRISKKYRRRYLSKKVSNPLTAAQRSRP